MPNDKMKKRFGYAKSIDAEKKQVVALVSTFEWDRTGERFARGAWDLANYMKNPVVLWAHDYGREPVGKAIEIREDEAGLIAITQFADTVHAKEVFELIKGGYLNAFSVGFNPRNYKIEPIDTERKGLVYTEAELLEYSVVPVPANPGAVIGREIAELAIKTFGDGAVIKTITTDSLGQEQELFMVPVDLSVPEVIPQQKQDLEDCLRGIIDLAKTARGQKLPEQQIQLVNMASKLFQEIIQENSPQVSVQVINDLRTIIKAQAEMIKNLVPPAEETVKQVMRQLERALSAGRPA